LSLEVNNLGSIVDEFADLEHEDVTMDLVDTCYEHVSTAIKMLENKSINGLDSASISQIVNVNPTELMEFEHVSLRMNTNNLYYLGGTLIKDFRVFEFVDEILPSNEKDQLSIIENIVIPSSVKAINSEAFYNYHYLKNVIFEDNSGLEYLGSGAFAYCPKILRLDLSSCVKLERLHVNTFACSGIKSVKLPDKLRSIHENAFADSEVREVIVGNTKYSIQDFLSTLKSNGYRNFWDFETMTEFC